MKGYLEELGITEDSKTETFASLIIDVATPRWKGVPFTLVTGKRLKEKRTTVEIFMKPSPLANQIAPDVSPNRIEIKVQPEEGVQIRFNALRPSSENSIVERELDFCQSCLLDERSPEAYEKLLLDALNNDPTLFTAWDEIEQAWKLVDPLVEKVRSGQVKLWPYEAGSAGPALPGLSII
jgi:glucose-6-phosphate 1-dehydrogenase